MKLTEQLKLELGEALGESFKYPNHWTEEKIKWVEEKVAELKASSKDVDGLKELLGGLWSGNSTTFFYADNLDKYISKISKFKEASKATFLADPKTDEGSLNDLGTLPNKKLTEAKGIDDEFVDYFNSFYGPEGIYKKANSIIKRPFTKEDLEDALKARDKERKFPFEGDSTDRETLRDRLEAMKKLNGDY